MNPDMQAAVENGQTLAAFIDQVLNGKTREIGFALLFFPLGKVDGTAVNYVGNCKRADMLVALKEIVARWEGQADTVGHA